MKRTTLRTSAIALGVAAALPATAQEWNLGWGGYMNQHIVFGSSEKKTTVSVDDLSYKFTGTRTDGSKYTAIVNIVDEAPSGATHILSVPDTIADDADLTKTELDTQLLTLINAIEVNSRAVSAGAAIPDNIYVEVGKTVIGADGKVTNTNTNENSGTGYVALHQKVADTNKAIKSSGTGQWPDAEIHFKPSITLENGLTFGAHVEFEALHHGNGGPTRDESYVTISSDSLGMFIIGSENSAGYRMMVAAPSVGLGINSGSHPDFLPGYDYEWRSASGSSNTEVGGNNDAMRISYHTPSLGGLTFGVSYAPDDGQNMDDKTKSASSNSGNKQLKIDDADIPLKDIIDLGVKFEQSLGEANVTLAARYGTGKNNDPKKKNPREIGFGAQVGFGAFTFGGAYADSERGSADKSSSGWSLGMAYDMDGPWKFGIETYQGKYDDGDKQGVSKIAASRTLGPGVVWDLYALTASSTQTQGTLNVGGVAQELVKPGDSGNPGAAGIDLDSSGKIDVDGTLFGTSIKLTF